MLQKGLGCMVILKVLLLPVHPLRVGVTVMVAVMLFVPELLTTKDGILPVPLAANPILVVLLVQLKIVLGMAPEKFIGAVVNPLQRV